MKSVSIITDSNSGITQAEATRMAGMKIRERKDRDEENHRQRTI